MACKVGFATLGWHCWKIFHEESTHFASSLLLQKQRNIMFKGILAVLGWPILTQREKVKDGEKPTQCLMACLKGSLL